LQFFADNHDVFVWGYGILGQGPNLQQSFEPVLLAPTLFGRNEFNPDIVVSAVSCGLGSNAAVNSDGGLFMWGKNRSACLGLGDFKDQGSILQNSISAENFSDKYSSSNFDFKTTVIHIYKCI
jgi:alpha-tubulin suppressor-like RCC1 family protein